MKGILRNLDEADAYWADISVEEIIEMYSRETDESVPVDRKKW